MSPQGPNCQVFIHLFPTKNTEVLLYLSKCSHKHINVTQVYLCDTTHTDTDIRHFKVSKATTHTHQKLSSGTDHKSLK